MAGATGKIAIYNKVIVLLGSRESLLSPDDPVPSAQSLSILWDIARRAALALHPFNFAIRREKLQRETEPPAFGYAYKFKLPAELLRWLPWSTDDEFYFDGEEEGGFILANDPDIFIRFIADIEDTAAWSPLFVDVMAYTLAAEYCEGKTGLRGLQKAMLDQREQILRSARRADGLATGKRRRTRTVGSSRWAGARFGNGVLGR